MKFQKGHTPWHKGKTGVYSDDVMWAMGSGFRGKKLSEATKIKMSLVRRGRKLTKEWKDNISKGNLGKKLTESSKIKIRAARAKQIITEEHKRKIGEGVRGEKNGNFGKAISEEQKRIISKSNKGRPAWNKDKPFMEIRGEKHPNWQGGITPINAKIRNSIEYDLWNRAVFARDNWTCQLCKIRGGKLHAHHIKPFAKHPELRLAIDNGQTLCRDCHHNIHRKHN